MKKKPEQYTRAGKSNVTLRNFLNNLKENDLHFENNQITQCVFLGVLRLKPVPTIFSSNNTSSDCSSIVESKPRRFRNNNTNKEGNKNISRKKDINKVISGKIRKKNPEKIKASVKKVPVKKPIIKVKLNMKKKNPNTSPSRELNTPKSDLIEENDSLKIPFSPPMFNPVDNLFSKLKQQIEHSQPGPSGVLPQDFIETSVCKINVNSQLNYSVKSKKSKKLGKKRSIIHERLAMPLLPGGQESVTSSDSSGFKEDLTSSSSHTSGSPISEQNLTIETTDVLVVSPEVPKVLKQKERTSPRNKGESKLAANDEEVFWINDQPMVDIVNLPESDVILIPDNVAEVPFRNSLRNDVIIIEETRGPRLSPRSKKTHEKTQEASGNEPNINSTPISKLTATQSADKSRSDLSAQSHIIDVVKTNEKQTSTLLTTTDPVLESTGEAEKSFDKPRRRRRLMPTAIPSIFFNTPMLLRSELAQKKPNGPEKKPVARGLSRLLRSELNKQEKPPKARSSNSQMTEDPSTLKLSKPPQKNYKPNDNLIYEVVKPAGVAATHISNLSESSSSIGNEVICLDDAPPKVEPLIIKLKVSQQKNFDTALKTKNAADAAKEKRDNSDSISIAPENYLLKTQVGHMKDTKSKETGLFSDTDKQKLVKPEISAEKTSSFHVSPPGNVSREESTVLPVKNYEPLKSGPSNRKSSPKVASPKKPLAMVSPKPVEINLVKEKKQDKEVATKNVDLGRKEISPVDIMKLTLPEILAVKVSPKPVEEKGQKPFQQSNISGNEKDISVVKLREKTRRLLRPENFSNLNQTVQKTVDPNVILIPDETQISSDSVGVTNKLSSQKVAVVACQNLKESAKSKDFMMFAQNQFQKKNSADQELSDIKVVPEIIDLCSADQNLEKRITIHSDFKLQFMKNEEPQSNIKDGDNDKNRNPKDNINANSKDINKNVNSKAISKIVNSKDNMRNVDLKKKSSELEEVKYIPKATRSSVVKEQLITPKTELSYKHIEANITAPIKQLVEEVKIEELDTVDSTLENIFEKESKRTLRSEMSQQKSALPPVTTADIKKHTVGPLDRNVNTDIQKSLEILEITKAPLTKPSEVGTSKLVEIPVEKMPEKMSLSNKKPDVAELPLRLLRSDKGQQKLLENTNKNILPEKIRTFKSDSSKQAKKTTGQQDMNTELSKKIDIDVETLLNVTDKESSKTNKSRSSIGQKSQKKQENLDEIIVLGEKKAKKPKESTTRLLRSSLIEPLLDSEPTTMKPEIEKVVVLIHDEPKSKRSKAGTAGAKEKLKGELMFPRSLRSQKTIAAGPPVKLNNRKGRKPALPIGKKSSLQDNKLKTVVKNKPSLKTHTLEVGVAKQNRRSKASRVLTKNGSSTERKNKIPITKKVTRQKVAQPLRRLRQRAVAKVPKKEWLAAKTRTDKLQKQVEAKNKKAPKCKNSVDWKNNEIIEKIIQEIRNTIFQDDDVEDNSQFEEGNVSSEENSPKENIVPTKKKTADTAKVSDKKKKIRRPSLKEIRNTKNTRANLQVGRYKTRQGNQNAKSKPILKKSFKRKLAETTSKRASQRVAKKVTKEDSVPNDPSLNTVESKEDDEVSKRASQRVSQKVTKEDSVPNDPSLTTVESREEDEVTKNFEPKKESVPCRELGEAYEADNNLKNISNAQETYQMVNSYLEEIVEGEENKTHQLKRKSEDLEYEVVARKQCKMIEDEATVSKSEATVSKHETTVSKAEDSVPKAEDTVSTAEATVYKSEATVSTAEATVPKAGATVSKAGATVLEVEDSTAKAVGKATKRRYKKRTSIKSVEELPVVNVDQSSSRLNEIEENIPTGTDHGQQNTSKKIIEKEILNGKDGQSVKTDGVKQNDDQVVAKRKCKTEDERQCKTEAEWQGKSEAERQGKSEAEFVRILKKLVKEMLPNEDLQQSCPELDQARCSTLVSNAKVANVIKRLCEDDEERQVQMTSEVLDGSSKKADITVFDFDESEPEVTPLRHKASPEKPTVPGKDKMWSPIEQPEKEIAKKVQKKSTVKEDNAKSHDESQTSTSRELEVPKKMWSRIEQPTKEVAKKTQRHKEDTKYTKAHVGSKTSGVMEMEVPKKMWSRIEVPTEMKPPPAPKNKRRKSLEVLEAPESPQGGSSTKATSPMKQPTIIEMFNKVRLKLEQGGSATDSAEDSPVAESRVSIEEANFSAMPPPKMERFNCKTECMEDDDSDCESRAEWIPEEYAEYKMKYSAQKMMQYKPVFKCKVCLKVMPSYYRLTKHRKEHELRDNPYVCRECDADFGNIDELTAHLRVHKGKFPYTCSKCNVGFWTKTTFDAHAPIHVLRKLKPPVKKFRCDVCAKEFSKLCDIDRHMRVHTGEKPCICNICNKGFQQSHNLSKHLLTHLHIRPFHCEICDKQFGRGDVLARHVFTHSIDKPIKCWVCYKGFIRQTQLVQHHQKYHRDQPLVKPELDEGEEVA